MRRTSALPGLQPAPGTAHSGVVLLLQFRACCVAIKLVVCLIDMGIPLCKLISSLFLAQDIDIKNIKTMNVFDMWQSVNGLCR